MFRSRGPVGAARRRPALGSGSSSWSARNCARDSCSSVRAPGGGENWPGRRNGLARASASVHRLGPELDRGLRFRGRTLDRPRRPTALCNRARRGSLRVSRRDSTPSTAVCAVRDAERFGSGRGADVLLRVLFTANGRTAFVDDAAESRSTMSSLRVSSHGVLGRHLGPDAEAGTVHSGAPPARLAGVFPALGTGCRGDGRHCRRRRAARVLRAAPPEAFPSRLPVFPKSCCGHVIMTTLMVVDRDRGETRPRRWRDGSRARWPRPISQALKWLADSALPNRSCRAARPVRRRLMSMSLMRFAWLPVVTFAYVTTGIRAIPTGDGGDDGEAAGAPSRARTYDLRIKSP